MASTPCPRAEKKKWWLTKRRMVDKHIANARNLIATQQPSDFMAAVGHLDMALAFSPRHETALELKARSLLFLRKFKDVANMLEDYIPSFKSASEDDDSGSSSVSLFSGNSRERVKLLPSNDEGHHRLLCFSVSELKKKVLAGLKKRNAREGYWRYIVLGQACCHLGMMEDAMVLLQTGRRLAAAAFRRESHDLHDDEFSDNQPDLPTSTGITAPVALPTTPPTELESAAHLLNHIKLLLRRRAAAMAALEANLPLESIRHFSKILDSRRSVPSPFAALCFIGRAAAYKSAGRIADSISDCNRALALDPSSIPAMRERADLLESVRNLPDCLRDLDHLKLLYDAILQDRKLPGPPWRPHHGIRYRDIPSELRKLTARIQEMRQRVGKGEGWNVDYYGIMGLKRACSRSELDRTHLLLSLKHRPDRAAGFVDRLEFADEHRDVDTVRDEARMSALILYRLLQKGHTSIMSDITEADALEKQRIKEKESACAFVASTPEIASTVVVPSNEKSDREKDMAETKDSTTSTRPSTQEKMAVSATVPRPPPVYQGVFCRDLAVVGSLLSQTSFNRTIPVKLEALSC